jgi:hypothetical protein
VWGAIDAANHPEPQWEAAGLSRGTWVRWQALGALFVVGFFASIAYFAKTRPTLEATPLVTETVAA